MGSESNPQSLLFEPPEGQGSIRVRRRGGEPGAFTGPSTVSVAARLAKGPGPTVTLELHNDSDRDLELLGSVYFCGGADAPPPARLASSSRAAFGAVHRAEDARHGVSAVWLYGIRSGLALAVFVYHPIAEPVVHGAWLTPIETADDELYALCWAKRRGGGEHPRGLSRLRQGSLGFLARSDAAGAEHSVVRVRLTGAP